MAAAKRDAENPEKRSPRTAASGTTALQEGFLSPGFRSAAAMAGWDEEALLLASQVVEDTPVRESRHGKRPGHRPFRTPPTSTNSKRKRRSRRQSPESAIQPVVLCLDEDDNRDQAAKKDTAATKNESTPEVAGGADEEKKAEASLAEKGGGEALPCMDRLREELSCAICLEVCFEPSTTPCGHSFCIKCLKCAAAKCGKRCPKCRQLISNGRSCTVNTVLWNTIQLLFPKDVEARKDAANAMSPSNETRHEIIVEGSNRSRRIRVAARASQNLERDQTFRRRAGPSQSEDAALAFRLQREEFMVSFQGTSEQQRNALHAARVNLRAIRSRALHIRTRNRAS